MNRLRPQLWHRRDAFLLGAFVLALLAWWGWRHRPVSLKGIDVSRIEIIAHRGASAEAPENTLAAVSRAWEIGAPAAEVDVHLTADGQIVCLHDDTTKRTTGTELYVSNATYAELAALDAGSWKGAKFVGERIPLLADVLAAMPEGRRLYIEIKDSRSGLVDELARVLDATNHRENVAVISFDLGACDTVRRTLPDVDVYWILDAEPGALPGMTRPIETRTVETAKAMGLRGLDLDYRGVSKDLADAAKTANLRLVVWTVDSVPDAKELARLGVEGITTNEPKKMLEGFAK